jgi:ribosome-binding factor A
MNMSNRRGARIASAVQQEVSRLLLTEVKDPRIGIISVTGVTMNDDFSVAHIQYLPLGGLGDRKAIQEGLKSAARSMRGTVGRALGTRHSPELRFEIDRNLEYSLHMNDVLSNLPKPADQTPPDANSADDAPSKDDEG